MHALRDLIHECGISITLSQNGITKAHKIQSKSKAQKKRKQRTSKEQHMAYNNNNNNNKKIVVFGATGSVGTDLIEIVSNNEPNWKIVAVSRSGPNTNARLASLHLPNVDIPPSRRSGASTSSFAYRLDALPAVMQHWSTLVVDRNPDGVSPLPLPC